MVRLTSDALITSWSPAFRTTGMAPLAMLWFFILILHGTAEVDTFAFIKIKVGIAIQALILGRTVATLAIWWATLANCIIDPESNRALWNTRSMSWVVEGQQVEVISTSCTISDWWTGGASGITCSTSFAVSMREGTNWASQETSSLINIIDISAGIVFNGSTRGAISSKLYAG